MQVQLHVDLEKKMPRRLFEKVNEMEYVVVYGEKLNQYDIFKVRQLEIKIKFNYYFKSMVGKIYCSEITTLKKNENDPNQILYNELLKQKEKFKVISSILNKQTDLLRSILKKLNLKTYDSEENTIDDDEINGDDDTSLEFQMKKNSNDRNKINPRILNYAQNFRKSKLQRSNEVYDSL